MMKLQFKLLTPTAKLPIYAHPGEDVGLDLFSVENLVIPPGGRASVHTGVAIVPPTKEEVEKDPLHLRITCQVWPRSGNSFKCSVERGAGLIDPTYNGEVMVKLYNQGVEDFIISVGDRIAQLLPLPAFYVEPVEYTGDVSNTSSGWTRNSDGFGSSGK